MPERVLVVSAHFLPEPTGNAPYTGALATGLAERGMAVAVITTHPHYPEWSVRDGYGQWTRTESMGGARVTRLRHYVPAYPSPLRRALAELSFGARVVSRRWGRPSAIMAVSPALLSTWLTVARARVTHRRTPLVVWVQDLYSRGLRETGQGNSVVNRLIARVERWVLQQADRVVVIHERFAAEVVSYGVDTARIEVVRNWTHLPPRVDVDVEAVRRARGWMPGQTVVLHAGNMGVKQGLENVVDAARLADSRNTDVRFVLVGGGSEREKLVQLATGVSRIEIMPPLDDTSFAQALHAADVLLINEKAGIAEMSVPSKLTSYFSAGRPVLAATDAAGITADEIRLASAGVVVPAGDPEALLDGVVALVADPRASARMGWNGVDYCSSVLDQDHALDAYARLLRGLIADSAA